MIRFVAVLLSEPVMPVLFVTASQPVLFVDVRYLKIPLRFESGFDTCLPFLSLYSCTALHSTAQHSTAPHSTAQHSTAQHSTAQHSTAQHSTAQHSTAQHSTAQHSTAKQSTAEHGKARQGTAQHSTEIIYQQQHQLFDFDALKSGIKFKS